MANTLTWKKLSTGALLTGTAASVYEAPAGTYATIQAASCSNDSGGVVDLNVYIVPSGGSAGVDNLIVRKSVADIKSVPLYELLNYKLEPGDEIFADGDGAYLNIAGVESFPD